MRLVSTHNVRVVVTVLQPPNIFRRRLAASSRRAPPPTSARSSAPRPRASSSTSPLTDRLAIAINLAGTQSKDREAQLTELARQAEPFCLGAASNSTVAMSWESFATASRPSRTPKSGTGRTLWGFSRDADSSGHECAVRGADAAILVSARGTQAV